MLTGWKLKFAPLWVPIIPATVTWLMCFISLQLTTEIVTISMTPNMRLNWQNAQIGIISFVPDPFFAAITVYITTMPCVYLMVGKILQDRALKESELKSGESDAFKNGGGSK